MLVTLVLKNQPREILLRYIFTDFTRLYCKNRKIHLMTEKLH